MVGSFEAWMRLRPCRACWRGNVMMWNTLTCYGGGVWETVDQLGFRVGCGGLDEVELGGCGYCDEEGAGGADGDVFDECLVRKLVD